MQPVKGWIGGLACHCHPERERVKESGTCWRKTWAILMPHTKLQFCARQECQLTNSNLRGDPCGRCTSQSRMCVEACEYASVCLISIN